jgi:hypothetical protein
MEEDCMKERIERGGRQRGSVAGGHRMERRKESIREERKDEGQKRMEM